MMTVGFAFRQTNQNELNYLFLLPLVSFAVKRDDCVGQAPTELGRQDGEEKTPPTKQDDMAKSKQLFGTK